MSGSLGRWVTKYDPVPCLARRSLEVEVSGWRDELRLRVHDARRHRLPHVEVFPSEDDDDHRRRSLADDRWHTVSVRLTSTPRGGGGGGVNGGFYVRVDVDCRPVAARRVDDRRLPWTPPVSHLDDLSYLWVGQRSATESLLKASRSLPVYLSTRSDSSLKLYMNYTGNESAPIQLARCWFRGLAISDDKY